MASNNFESKIFNKQLRRIRVADEEETVLYGGDRDFSGLGDALDGVNQFAVIGWSSQGPAHAQNLRESFATAGIDTKVVVGLRNNSPSRVKAEAAGFDIESGTLMTVEEALGKSAMSLFLIADASMAHDGKKYLSLVPSGATVGLAHGFYPGYLEATGQKMRDDINVVGVCPKGMGPSVRQLYEQGSGINASYALEKGDDAARDRALAWSLALGAPNTFQTTLNKEWRSDIFGERAILLGGVHGIVEAMYLWKRQHDVAPATAYIDTVESLVGPISKTISSEGLIGVLEKLEGSDREKFEQAYNAAYPVLKHLTQKIYRDVSSGREIAEVISDHDNEVPMTIVDGTDMWRIGEMVRNSFDYPEKRQHLKIDPEVAGIYIAGMIAQVDVLRANDHHWSEVVNESIIEAVDSLNPFMRARGVAYMVDGCSETARRGSRKWAPQYQAWILQGILPVLDGTKKTKDTHDYFADFKDHPVHNALRVLSTMRPPIDIAVA
jgi:ketol-acid reductoisomerase